MSRTPLVLLLLAVAAAAAASESVRPLEPEVDNPEYLLDLVTGAYAPDWHDAWEARDNGFRMRVGSNNEAQWFLEEELKAAAILVEDRARLRFHHTRRHRHSTRRLDANTLELEVRIAGRTHASLFVSPTAAKADNAVGLSLRNRRAPDRYSMVFVEFPHVFRNFAERERNEDGVARVFTDKPIRLGAVVRERPFDGLVVRADAELIPAFRPADEVEGEALREERVYARSAALYAEYRWSGSKRRRLVVEGGYRLEDRRETFSPPAAPGEASLSLGLMEFDDDLYRMGQGDELTGWRSRRAWVEPSAWFAIDTRWVLRAGVRVEERSIRYARRDGPANLVESAYVVPIASMRYSPDARGRWTLEAGGASSMRERRLREGGATTSRDIDDHRAFVAFEYEFGAAGRVRLIETFELDSGDRGEYGIHDHGFLQLLLAF